MSDYETVIYEQGSDHVATITLNRPQALNACSVKMLDEMKGLWARGQHDPDVHVIGLRAAPGRAFCTGVDQVEHRPPPPNIWSQPDPGESLGPKTNECWKPVVTAVHGMCAGGAFYMINESDIVICSDDATFFDPHVTYGMTAAMEPIGMTYRQHLGDVLRMTLLGNDERISARTAERIGIVSEVTSLEDLWPRAHDLAGKIAAKPTAAIQGTVRAIWESLDMPRSVALKTALKYCQLGNPLGTAQVDRPAVMAAAKKYEIR